VKSIVKRLPAFWLLQFGGWLAYGIILVLSTVPFANERATVAYRSVLFGCCFIASFVLHAVCRRQWRRGFTLPRSLFIVLAWCSGLAVVCAAIAVKAEYAFGTGLLPFRLLLPLTSITTAGFILLSWSALYFGIKYYQATEAERHRATNAEKSARESELRALRYQVHPHFLFNTLNAISTLVIEGERDAATAMITRLADFFRATLEEHTTEEVPLQNELFLTKQYLEIEQLRLGDRLRVAIDVNPALLACRVPHLVLQPLVENAIRHGIAPRRGAGLVSIEAHRTQDKLLISVKDDGLGKQPRDGVSNDGGGGIGLTNIDKRLRELYGDSGRLDLIWPSSGGCQAVLKIPCCEDAGLFSNGNEI
jgi:two-component system, LytTR family, sensor kinase